MAMVKKSVLIERSSQQMFNLVDRVEDLRDPPLLGEGRGRHWERPQVASADALAG